MLFSSYQFIFFFLPITFLLYYFLLGKRLVLGAKALLVFASLFFYAWWNVAYLPIILVSILFNYTVGRMLGSKDDGSCVSKKALLLVGITANLLLLCYFKYVDFFISNINALFDISLTNLNLLLPLAISFFTFQQIAYLVDSYEGQTSEYDFLSYTLFVTFFPQLIAGPIVHHKEMMPQFVSKFNLIRNYRNIAAGLFIFSIGLFKKLVIADTFAKWANYGFDQAETLTFVEGWVTSLSYTFQLYYDFSGYTDMAIGSALLFNIRLPINFNSPYKSLDIQDFWRRWHITLSRFLRDYIYIPLGGNRKGQSRMYGNLFATFLLGGLWHGAGWTFVFWGALHGGALVLHRIWKNLGFTMNKVLAWFITFNFVNIAWVFFRAREWEDALKVLQSMMNVSISTFYVYLSTLYVEMIHALNSTVMDVFLHSNELLAIEIKVYELIELMAVFVVLLISLLAKNSNELLKDFVPSCKSSMVVVSMGLYAFLVSVYWDHNVEFLYFNF